MKVLIQSPITNSQVLRILHQYKPTEAVFLIHKIFNGSNYSNFRNYLLQIIFNKFNVKTFFIRFFSFRNMAILIRNFKFIGISLNEIFSLNYKYEGLITDSIMRSRLWIIYLKFSLIKSPIRFIYRLYVFSLSFYYRATLKEIKPEIVFVSHTTYVCYGLLERICKELHIKCICIGPHRTGYFVSDSSEHHLNYIIHSILNKKTTRRKFLKRIDNLGFSLDHSLIYNDAKIKRNLSDHIHSFVFKNKLSDLDKNKKYKVAFFVALHCLRDMNSLFNQGIKLFDNYYDWLIFVLNTLSKNKNHQVFIALHPFHDSYNEKSFLINVVKRYISKNNHFQLLDKTNTENILPVVITASGSISIESASLGIKSVITEKACVPLSHSILTDSRENLEKLLLKNYSKNNWIKTFTCESDKSINQITAMIHNFGKPKEEMYKSMVFVDYIENIIKSIKDLEKKKKLFNILKEEFITPTLVINPQEIMKTKYGEIIPIDKDSLRSFDEIREKTIIDIKIRINEIRNKTTFK